MQEKYEKMSLELVFYAESENQNRFAKLQVLSEISRKSHAGHYGQNGHVDLQ